MKENIMLSIAALDVPMSDIVNDVAVAKNKFSYNEYCFTWATVLGLLNEIKNKDISIYISGVLVPLNDIVSDVEVAKGKYHYTDRCFTWATVEALCDAVDSQYTFNGLHFFYNKDGTKVVQKNILLGENDWFAIEHENESYNIFKKIDGTIKKIQSVFKNELYYFSNKILQY